jgi:hypothetical protein
MQYDLIRAEGVKRLANEDGLINNAWDFSGFMARQFSMEVHIHVTYTVIDVMWLTADVNLAVVSIKMETA